MPYAIKHVPELKMIEVVLTGVITGADLNRATTECVSLQKQTGVTTFLIDANGWEVTASPIDIFDLPARQYREEGVKRESRIAVIRPTSSSAREAARTYETMCRNRGWQARICQDRQSAINWLVDTR